MEQNTDIQNPNEDVIQVENREVSDEFATEVRTFLIADLRDYTAFTHQHGDEAAARLALKFASLSRARVAARAGQVIEVRGDEVLAVFGSARQALRAAVEMQNEFDNQTRSEPALPLRAGIGLDAGEAVRVETGYRGGALNLAARLCSQARAGEVLASETVVHLARKLAGLVYVERGQKNLKGLTDPVNVFEVRSESASSPPVQTQQASVEIPKAMVEPESLPVGGFLGAFPEHPFVARESELTRIATIVKSVERSRGRLAMVVGEPGIGKTRLAQEASLMLRERRMLVAAATCYEHKQTVPFHPWMDILTTIYTSCNTAMQSEFFLRWPNLERLLPDHAGTKTRTSGNGREEQEALFRSVTDFVRTVAEILPIGIMLDDLHWADASSLELLQHLARQTRASQVLLFGMYREDEFGRQPALESAMLELNRQQLVDWISVRRLTVEEMTRLVPATIGDAKIPHEFVSVLHSRTDGNPFFAQELLHALIERGDLYRLNGQWVARDLKEIQVPARVRAIVGQRLARLSDIGKAVVQEASVLGQTFAFDHLQRSTGRDEKQLEQALQEAVTAGTLLEMDDDRFSFSHTLTRQTIYEDLPGRRRRRLHLAAAQALESLSDGAGEKKAGQLAWHYLQADIAGESYRYSVIAGDQAETMFAHGDAERHYRTALEVAQRGSEPGHDALALEKLGSVLNTEGKYDEAMEVLERAFQAYEAVGDEEGQRRVAASIGFLHAQLYRNQVGIARLRSVLEVSENASDSRGLAMLHVSHSQLLLSSGDPVNALAAAQRAADISLRVGDNESLKKAELRIGDALGQLGRFDEARQVLERIAQDSTFEDLGTLVRALAGMGAVSLLAGRFEESNKYQDRALQLANQIDDPRLTVAARFSLATTRIFLGDWQRAEEELGRGIATGERVGLSQLVNRMKVTGALIPFLRGDWDAAEAIVGEVQKATNENRVVLPVSIVRSRLDIARGQYGAARLRLSPLLEQLENTNPDTVPLLGLLAQAYLGQGELSLAEQSVDQLIACATLLRHRIGFLDALWIRGSVRSAQRRDSEAARLYDAALNLATNMPYPFQRARILHDYGLLDIQSCDYKAASTHLREALGLFQQLGASKHVESTQQALTLADDDKK